MGIGQDVEAQRAASVALRRVEDVVRREVERALAPVAKDLVPALAAGARVNPGMTAVELLARDDIAALRAETIQAARREMTTTLHAAYRSGAALARGADQDPGPSLYLDQLAADVDRALDDLDASIVDVVTKVWETTPLPGSYHEVEGGSTNPARDQARARADAIRTQLGAEVRTTALRTSLSAGVALHRGYTEEQLRTQLPGVGVGGSSSGSSGEGLLKVWLALGPNPCESCQALHGTVIPLGEDFPVPAVTGGARVYRDLQGPPRHPRCRCRLAIFPASLETGPSAPADLAGVIRREERPSASISAEAVREMPTSRFEALLAALLAVVRAGIRALGEGGSR